MKHTKRFMSIILSIVMLMNITAGLDFSAYANTKNIKKIYEPIINKYYDTCNKNHNKNFYGGCNICEYALYDIDSNGIIELIVEEGTCEQDRTQHVYTINGDKAKYLGCYNAWHLAIYKGKEKIVGVDGMGGSWTIYDITINSNEVKKVAVKDIESANSPNINSEPIYFEEIASLVYLHEFSAAPCYYEGHKYNNKTTKATLSKNGKLTKKCKICGYSKTNVIYYPKTITLSTTSYTYDGKVKKPSVAVKDSKGKKIAASNYTVTYSSGRKNVGKYTVTIKFKGNYSGTVKKTFTIKPKTTSISKLTAGKKKFTIKWKKKAAQTTGYQIQYSTSSKFKNAKTITVSKNKTTSKTISKLKAKKKYYVRIRTYKTVNGTKYYSSWSKSKSVTTKK